MTIQTLKCVCCSEEYEIDTEKDLPKSRCDRYKGMLLPKWEDNGEIKR